MRPEQIRSTHPTPERTVEVTFNYSEDLVTERSFQMRRTSAQMRPKPENKVNVIQLATGHWILKPEQDLSLVTEKASLHAYQLRVSQCGVAPHVSEIVQQRKYTEFTGIGAAVGVASSGDYYMVKRIAAGDTWNQVVTSGQPAPVLPSANYPLDRVMVGPMDGAIPEGNTGWLLKIRVPGAAGQTPDFFAGFRFGGEQLGVSSSSTHTGYGLYYVALAGDGLALLHEFIDSVWKVVARWQWGSPRDTPILMLVLRIIPHGDRSIEFSTFNAGLYANALQVVTESAMHLFRANLQESEARGVLAYTAQNHDAVAAALRANGAPLTVTGPGYVAVDIRRDLRAAWQVSRLVYPSSGDLWCEPFQIPYGYLNAHPIAITPFGNEISQGSTALALIAPEIVTASEVVANDKLPLVPATETYTLGGTSHLVEGWEPPADGACRAHFQFLNEQADGFRYQTPVLTGYTVTRRPHTQTVSPGEFTPAKVVEVSITGPGYDPSEETGFVAIEDVTNAAATLKSHGRQPVRITTTYPGIGAEPPCVLFEGYVGRATAKRKGKAGKTFPSASWHRYDCELLGKWDRLQATTFHERFNFSDAADSPSGPSSDPQDPAWRVTDVFLVLLSHAGFNDTQVNIPSLDTRLWASKKSNNEDLFTPALGSWVAPYLQRLAMEFLNYFFIWDANAGTSGMWRLLPPPLGASPTPVWTFTTARPTGTKLAHLSASYGASTSPVVTLLSEYAISPEFSALTIRGNPIGTVDGRVLTREHTFINPVAFSSPTHPGSADSDDLDYLPRLIDVTYEDPSLPTLNAVRFVGRRIAELAGRGHRWREFVAETVLLPAATLEPTIYTARLKRPLRPGDLVMMDSERWVIHSNSPAFRSSGLMFSHYEAELYREKLTWG